MKIQVMTDVLNANQAIAQENKKIFDQNGIMVLNLLSSPGAGKTLILEKTIEKLEGEFKFAVIEGDVATSNDAERLAKYDIPVVQITTESFGGACHLDANMVKRAMDNIDFSSVQILFIENIGNLICPAGFDLGEDKKVIVLSVTEGEDKPSKYPAAFRKSSLVLLNKSDLLPHLDMDLDLILRNTMNINPGLKSIKLSAKTGEGFEEWLDWVKKEYRVKFDRKSNSRISGK
jgi:hydrogenase nickel incorporation protein HypB